MKTATIPSGSRIDKLMDVSAEVTLALESLEQHTKDMVFDDMVSGVEYGMHKLEQAYTDLVPQQLKVVKACMAEGVSHAVQYVLANVGVHERHLGLVTAQTPANSAKNAFGPFEAYLTTLWEDVNS